MNSIDQYHSTMNSIDQYPIKIAVRPMKIDIVFLVPARMGFICRTKFFHYSLFLKNRLNKTYYCCISQAQLKLYLSKDITRQNASIFHVSPGMCRNILTTVV